MSFRETIYKSRDNTISLAIEQGDELLSASNVTRCRLVFKRDGQANINVDSATGGQAGAFDFGQNEIVRGQNTRLLVLKLGALATSIPIPDGLYEIDVYLYDVVNTNGAFFDTLVARVRGGDT